MADFMPRAVFTTATAVRAWLELTVNEGVTLLDSQVAADVERLDAYADSLEDVRPSIQCVSGHDLFSVEFNNVSLCFQRHSFSPCRKFCQKCDKLLQ